MEKIELSPISILKEMIDYSDFILVTAIFYFVMTILAVIGLSRLMDKLQLFSKAFTYTLIAVAIFLLSGNLVLLTIKQINITTAPQFKSEWDKKLASTPALDSITADPKRDVYLIVLDGYGSNEVLASLYDYDNSAFTDELVKMGFVIIPSGRTNYSQTRTSFSSILNMTYLDQVKAEVGEDSIDSRPLLEMIHNSLVVKNFRDSGYTIINFPAEYEYTENINSDYSLYSFPYLNSFNQMIFSNTLAYPVFHNALYQWHREDLTYTIRHLAQLKNFSSPKFVVAHIYAPHPPFVFTSDGQPENPPYRYAIFDTDRVIMYSSRNYYKTQYIEQLQYVSSQILETIRIIQNQSELQPIIIICGDHGPGMTVSQNEIETSNHFERMHILNALYLPETNPAVIPPDLTPVNTFRIVFNQYFGMDYPLLPNHSYASSINNLFKFEDVTTALETNVFQGE